MVSRASKNLALHLAGVKSTGSGWKVENPMMDKKEMPSFMKKRMGKDMTIGLIRKMK